MNTKYSAAYIRTMARAVMAAERDKDPRATTLLLRLAHRVRMPLPTVRGLLVRIAT